MTSSTRIRCGDVLGRGRLAGALALFIILLGLLTACAGRAPTATPVPPTVGPTMALPTPAPSATPPAAPAADATRQARQKAIPAGVYAMLDWNRNAAADTHPWIKAGHNAFTWRQISPARDQLDWGVVDRWLDAEAGRRDAPTGVRVGLGVNAYDGLDSTSAPQWILDDYAIMGYVIERRVSIAANEHSRPEQRPALLVGIQTAGGATQEYRFQYGLGGYVESVDTGLDAANPKTAYGAAPQLALGGAGQANLLLRFPLRGLPAGAQVVSATLVVFVTDAGADKTPLPVVAHAVTRPWEPAEATWLAPRQGETWVIRGANGVMTDPDRDVRQAGEALIQGAGPLLIPLEPTVVQAWADAPALNLGLLIKQKNGDLPLPCYWEAGYLAALETMVKELGRRYGDDPRVAWVEISVGIYGETTPVNKPALKWSYAEAGLTSNTHAPEKGLYSWVDTVIKIIDIYRAALPATPLFLQYSNNFESVSERAAYVPYAVERGIGLKHNGLYPDSIDGATQGGPAVGTFNIMFTYSETVPTGWEFQVFPRTPGPVYWAMLNALDKRADFVLVQKDAITRTELIPIFEFANRYLGATLQTTPGVWTALRETERPAERWNTQHGNFNFWMQQVDTAPGGKTVPLWNVTDAKEGLFTRRTDQASGNRYMFFDIDDAYFRGGRPLVLEVVYLDRGRDSWHIEYDAGDGKINILPSVRKEDSNAWKRVSFTLNDAAMAGGLAGYDWRIDCEGDGDEIIHWAQATAQGQP